MKTIIETGEVCTTQRAAEILGISISSVQQLVESGAITAWKTQGGHRRIPLAAVLSYKAQLGALHSTWPVPDIRRPTQHFTIVVVEDNPMQRALHERQLQAWDLPAQVVYCGNGYQALLEIARRRPAILLTDIVMDGIDGYEVLNTVIADPELRPTHIAILSGLSKDDLDARGGLPTGTVFFSKPVNYDELRGYLRACCAHQQLSRAQIS
jgi:excisionase family DNA binding protein